MASNYGLDGVEALREAANAVGVATDKALASTDTRADLALVTPGGDRLMVALKRFSLVSAEGLQERIGQMEPTFAGYDGRRRCR